MRSTVERAQLSVIDPCGVCDQFKVPSLLQCFPISILEFPVVEQEAVRHGEEGEWENSVIGCSGWWGGYQGDSGRAKESKGKAPVPAVGTG